MNLEYGTYLRKFVFQFFGVREGQSSGKPEKFLRVSGLSLILLRKIFLWTTRFGPNLEYGTNLRSGHYVT